MTRRPAVLGLLIAAVLACGTAYHASRPTDLVVRVQNSNWSDAVVYVICGSRKLARIGPVTTNSEVVRDVPLHGCYNIRFVIDLIGSRQRYSTESIQVEPKQIVVLRIENYLPLTQPWVRSAEESGGK